MSTFTALSKWVVARKRHRCDGCWGPIPVGEEHYYWRGVFDGAWQENRLHRECEQAHANDGYEEFIPGDYPVPERLRAGR